MTLSSYLWDRPSHAAAFIEEFVRKLPTVLEETFWSQFRSEVEHAFNADVIFPLRDSTHCMASSVGKAITAIRTGVVKSAGEAIQLVLRSSPPAGGFFFGDPSSQVHSSLNFALMSSLVSRPKATPAKPFTKRAVAGSDTTPPPPHRPPPSPQP